MASPRIVSLLPSATEIVASVGHKDGLVGRSHECDFPLGVETLPVCTRPRVKLDGSSLEIDRKVKEIVGRVLSVYEVLNDTLKDASPDIIVTQNLCEVCAVSLPDVEAAVADWVGGDIDIVSLNAESTAAVYDDIRRVANALKCRGVWRSSRRADAKPLRRDRRTRGRPRPSPKRRLYRMGGTVDGGGKLDTGICRGRGG